MAAFAVQMADHYARGFSRGIESLNK